MGTITYRRIPEDLIFNILLRLTVKSLLRFKCVSKIWLALITSPDFIHKHLLWEGQKTVVLAYWSTMAFLEDPSTDVFTLFMDETLDKHEEPDHLKIPPLVSRIRGPCNGVFCILSRNQNMALWNPTTRKMRPLPVYPSHFLAAIKEVAIGFNPLNDEFKVVLFFVFCDEHIRPFFDVYTSSNDSWRLVENEALEDRNIVFSDTVNGTTFVNGFYYWLRYDRKTLTCTILAFDMHEEVFEQIEIPEIVRSCWNGDLNIYDDNSLALFAHGVICDVESVDIWTMKEKGCWTKLLTYVPSVAVAWSFGFWMKSRIILQLRNAAELVVYDLNSSHTKRLKIEKVGAKFKVVLVYYYKESLVSVKAGCGSRDYEIHSTGAQHFFTRETSEADDLL